MNKRFNKKFDNKKRKFFRVNFQIQSPYVRVVKDDEQIGVLPIDKARKIAQDSNLDLVEIVPDAKPPVCKIISFDKFKYQQKQKEKETKKKQKVNEIKQIRLKPNIQDHDVEIKVKSLKRFLEEGKKVLLNMQFKNRELAYKDKGFTVISKIIAEASDLSVIEINPKFEGTRLICRLSPILVVGDKNAL